MYFKTTDKPIRLMHFPFVADQPVRAIEERRERADECGMKVVTCPRYPVVTVEDVRIGIMERPEEKADGHNVQRNVDENRSKASWHLNCPLQIYKYLILLITDNGKMVYV